MTHANEGDYMKKQLLYRDRSYRWICKQLGFAIISQRQSDLDQARDHMRWLEKHMRGEGYSDRLLQAMRTRYIALGVKEAKRHRTPKH